MLLLFFILLIISTIIYGISLNKKKLKNILTKMAALPMFKADEQYMSPKLEVIAIDRHHNKICIIDKAGECHIIDFGSITACEPIIDATDMMQSNHRGIGTKIYGVALGSLTSQTEQIKKIRQAGIKISTMGTKHPYYKFLFLDKGSYGSVGAFGRQALERTEYWHHLIIMAMQEDGQRRMYN